MMLRIVLFAVLAAVAWPAASQTAAEYPDDSPDWLPMAEAVAEVQAGDNILLVHAYTIWCGWCREMDAKTYTDDAVQAYLAENYEVTRLDIESPEAVDFFGGRVAMRELGEAFGVSSTPTTVFLNSDGSYITRAPSFIPPDRFLMVLRFVNERAYEMMDFHAYMEMIEAAERSGG